MTGSNQANLHKVDWSSLPKPQDDGKAAHLQGHALPPLALPTTASQNMQTPPVTLQSLKGTTVVFAYPMTANPDIALPENWDMIPGARGCTPQACAFRDLFSDLRHAGADHVFGLSTQDTAYQTEAANRLHLPFALLSDHEGKLHKALQLPTIEVEGQLLLKRLTMIIKEGIIAKIWYPVFPPDQNPDAVLSWLKNNS